MQYIPSVKEVWRVNGLQVRWIDENGVRDKSQQEQPVLGRTNFRHELIYK
jgi:hypothetical protein